MQVQQEFTLIKLSTCDNVAATFESSKARKVLSYCFQAGTCLDLVKDFDSLSQGENSIYIIGRCDQNVMTYSVKQLLQ